MLPRGMVGQKCHPPLSTTPEVWRCAAGRQASRSARRGWREIRGNSINGRFLRARERAQLHTHPHARCKHIVTNVAHAYFKASPMHLPLWGATDRMGEQDEYMFFPQFTTHLTPSLVRSSVSLFWYLYDLKTFWLRHSMSRVGWLWTSSLAVSLSLRWLYSVGALHCFPPAGQLRRKWGRGGHSPSVIIKGPYIPACQR